MDRIAEMQMFVRVAESGSFSRAAQSLGVGQPTITKNISALEDRLRVRLLYRNTRGVSLSEAGLIFFERAKSILADIEDAEHATYNLPTSLSGTLRISASVAFGRRVLSPLLIPFMRQHANLRIELSCDDRYVDLAASGIDLAVRLGRLADSAYGAAPLGFNPWIVVAAPSYLSISGTPTSAVELASAKALVYSSVQGDDIWRFAGPAGGSIAVPVKSAFKSNNLSALAAAACSGLGVAILPHYVAAHSLAHGRLKRILTDHSVPGQEMSAVYPSPRLIPPKVKLLIAFLRERLSGEWWLMRGDLSNDYSIPE